MICLGVPVLFFGVLWIAQGLFAIKTGITPASSDECPRIRSSARDIPDSFLDQHSRYSWLRSFVCNGRHNLNTNVNISGSE